MNTPRQESTITTETTRADFVNTVFIKHRPLAFKSLKSARLTKLADPVVALALSFIRQHALKQTVRVPAIARHCRVSRVTLERRFKKCLGRSPGQEVVRVRLAHAKKLLAETNLLINEVAKATGFALSTSKYFSKWFLQKTGQRPSKYRQLKRQSQWLAESQPNDAAGNNEAAAAPPATNRDGLRLRISADHSGNETEIRMPHYCPECGCNLLKVFWPVTMSLVRNRWVEGSGRPTKP